jgi:hypothetical protein
MKTVAIISRRLKEGKTYEDFRRAWFHTIGFGTPSRLFTMINSADPREIIVMGFVETNSENALATARIDVRERLANPLDDVIEPEIGRIFGILVAEDDFSAEGSIAYSPPILGGKVTDPEIISKALSEAHALIAQVSEERDHAHRIKGAMGMGKKDELFPGSGKQGLIK